MNLTGRDASVLIAQAIDESGWGLSGLSSRYSNYFGVSAGCVDSSISDPNEYRGQVLHAGEGGNHCSGNAYWNGDAVSVCSTRRCAWRRVYDSLENSAYDYATLSNYRECNQYASPYDQISCIKANGYAQDEEYVEKIMGLINSYNLTQYDIGHWDGTLLDSSGQPARYINRTCRYSADGTQYGDWANWKQGQGPWADQYIGNKTIGQVGCLVTSIAIQIQRSGVATILGDDFNPGTFVQAIKDYGPGFSNNSLNSRDVSNIAPDFKYQGNYQSRKSQS